MKKKLFLLTLIALYGCSSNRFEMNTNGLNESEFLSKRGIWVEQCEIDSNLVKIINKYELGIILSDLDGIRVVKYKDGLKNGTSKESYDKLTIIGEYKNGYKTRSWKIFDESGTLIVFAAYVGGVNSYIISHRVYKNGILIDYVKSTPSF